MLRKIAMGLLLVSSVAWAQAPGNTTASPNNKVGAPGNRAGAGPCMHIESDCKKNGYVVGKAGQGKGLWWDCMCPLIAPNFAEPSKNVLTVPSDSTLVAACRAHPHGQKIMSRCAAMLAKKNAKQAK